MGNSIMPLLFQAPTPATYSYSGKFFWLNTRRKQKITAFYINNQSEYTLLFSHGNAEDLGMIYDWFRHLSRYLGVNVMSYDYTGYGLNASEPSEKDCFADIEAAFEYLTKEEKIKPNRIILYGRSLGTGVSCHMAAKQSAEGSPVAGLILQSPLMSAYRVAFNFRFTLPGDKFSNIDKIGSISCPIFVIHGTRDEVVPFWHGQELYLSIKKEFKYKPFWVQDAGHNNIEMKCSSNRSLHTRLVDFIDHVRSSE